MNARLIVPRRADRGHRDRLWRFCAAYWRKDLPEYPIFEGHHDDGPFNRSAAINRAAEGEWDVAVILDGDTILDVELVKAAAELAQETGELVLPFHTRQMLTEAGTQEILGGYVGSWNRWVGHKEGVRHVSSCVVVPRALWDAVGGFDERFEGWGGEDDAFHAACKVLGGVERLKGFAWHLWHETSPWRDHRSPTYRQALALSNRYVRTKDARGMCAFLAEPRTPEQIAVVVPTTGRRKTLADTLASAEDMLKGPIGRKLIVAGTTPVREHRGWDVALRRSGSYSRAMAQAIDLALGCGQPWIFWLEDDFTFDEPVDLCAMQALMDANPHMAQLSLKRQAWYPHEVEAGGIVEAKPEAFTQREGYVEHRDYWTMNPMLVRRSFLAEHYWPRGRGSERQFGRQVFTNGTRAGILGALEDEPRVTHIGVEQAGTGY